MMLSNSYARFLMLLFVVGIAFASEGYLNYGDDPEDRNLENLQELYKMLLRRNSMDNLAGLPLEHLMIRKSQRSPSLRLRFGRSGSAMSAGIGTRPIGKQDVFDDN